MDHAGRLWLGWKSVDHAGRRGLVLIVAAGFWTGVGGDQAGQLQTATSGVRREERGASERGRCVGPLQRLLAWSLRLRFVQICGTLSLVGCDTIPSTVESVYSNIPSTINLFITVLACRYLRILVSIALLHYKGTILQILGGNVIENTLD
jgi:hypothetical protein